MLEYVKFILQKVSFDETLFQKELKKSIQYLQSQEDIEHLRTWAYRQFKGYQKHLEIIDDCFLAVS